MKIGIIGFGKLGKAINNHHQNCNIFSNNLKTHETFEEFVKNSDVLIDCTTTEFDERASFINKPIIIATTQNISKYPQNCAILKLPNSSYSWNLVHETIIKLAKNQNYNFIIEDIHHKNKKDSPSGTAKRLYEELKELNAEVAINSSRGFDIVGYHTITAYNENEIIKIQHQILNRDVFALGCIKAAELIIKKSPDVYLYKDLI